MKIKTPELLSVGLKLIGVYFFVSAILFLAPLISWFWTPALPGSESNIRAGSIALVTVFGLTISASLILVFRTDSLCKRILPKTSAGSSDKVVELASVDLIRSGAVFLALSLIQGVAEVLVELLVSRSSALFEMKLPELSGTFVSLLACALVFRYAKNIVGSNHRTSV